MRFHNSVPQTNALLGQVLHFTVERRALLAENEALLDLVRLLLMPQLSDAQLRRKRDRLATVVNLQRRVH